MARSLRSLSENVNIKDLTLLALLNYKMVLSEYGGDNLRGRQAYKKTINEDMGRGLEIKDEIVAQSMLGGEDFIRKIREEIGKGRVERELPTLKALKRYRSKSEILRAVEKVTGKGVEEIRSERGGVRQTAMELLYNIGGLKGVEIGNFFGVDYSTVSLGRKRLREKLEKDKKLRGVIRRIEREL